MGPIDYRYGNELDLDQVIELYRDSTLGERRPIDDRSAWVLRAGDAFGVPS